jgi:hypothetical protein
MCGLTSRPRCYALKRRKCDAVAQQLHAFTNIHRCRQPSRDERDSIILTPLNNAHGPPVWSGSGGVRGHTQRRRVPADGFVLGLRPLALGRLQSRQRD